MKVSRSLRFRITLAFVLFVSITSSIFAGVVFYAYDSMEETVLDDSLRQEAAEVFQSLQGNPGGALPHSAHIRSFLVDKKDDRTLPAELRPLGQGIHHDISVQGRRYHLLVKHVDGRKLVLLYDITPMERREDIVTMILVCQILLGSVLALWVGFLMSKLVIAPVTGLANRVSRLGPGESGDALSREYDGYEVGVIARAFSHYLDRMKSFIARERAFTEDASHELRTPLAVIINTAELLEADANTPEPMRPVLSRISRAGMQMRRTIHALLFLARESGQGTDEADCRVDLVVAETLDSLQSLVRGKPVVLRAEVLKPVTVTAQRALLSVVVTNLVNNAIEHTESGSVKVVVSSERLSVEDTGRGMTDDEKAQIYERHYRSNQSKGFGLGMYLVKRICDRYGWRIEIQGSHGSGTQVLVSFS